MPHDGLRFPHQAADLSAGHIRAAEVAAMQDLLDRLRPGTGTEALRALREVFPTASLAARVEAMTRYAQEN